MFIRGGMKELYKLSNSKYFYCNLSKCIEQIYVYGDLNSFSIDVDIENSDYKQY